MENYKICDECGKKMLPAVVDREFRYDGKEILIKGLNAFKCQQCGNYVYAAEDAEMIEKLMHVFSEKENVDVLNLSETADLLRVSNQTIYNMIRAGRIKAYKAGREWRLLRSDIQVYIEGTSNGSFVKAVANDK